MHAVDHPQSRAQNGHDGNALLGNAVLHRLFQRSLYLNGYELHVVHAHIGHDLRDLLDQFAKFFHARALVAQNGDLVLDERMTNRLLFSFRSTFWIIFRPLTAIKP